MIDVREYIRRDGSNPFKVWFDSLDAQAAAKIAVATFRLGFDNTSNVRWFQGIGELKVDWGPGHRVYLAMDGDFLLVLLGGGTKKGQKADIRRAVELHNEYKARKALQKKAR